MDFPNCLNAFLKFLSPLQIDLVRLLISEFQLGHMGLPSIFQDTSFISSQRLVISGTIPPLQYLRTPSPTRPFNISAGSLAPPCCKNSFLRATPVLRDNGSSLQSFFHMLAAKHLAYK
ncbi:LOW QUALITY PROTEIN: hypothetical protein PanWU01x14_182490 [Parasponia andersonii]|uniref:Uncharacterized protein n=1 Tax=Parasponia andersonii TaxID=3476 RepID=A0A2P5C5B2_PARAD|nr:LOW QUALITY PROTEIN: hypothetical protein PanWU01x14_182490 [Parasponia andersonii]